MTIKKPEKSGNVSDETKEPDALTDEDLDKVNGGTKSLVGDDVGILRGSKPVDQIAGGDLGSGRVK